jgi:hypothetical protein
MPRPQDPHESGLRAYCASDGSKTRQANRLECGSALVHWIHSDRHSSARLVSRTGRASDHAQIEHSRTSSGPQPLVATILLSAGHSRETWKPTRLIGSDSIRSNGHGGQTEAKILVHIWRFGESCN